MGRGSTEAAYRVGTVDCMTSLCKEDRVRHRSIVEFFGVVILLHPESAKAIGSEYLRQYPQDANVDVLLDQIASRLAANDVGLFSITDQSLREQLDGMVRADFAIDRIVKLHGWVLSATEARLCALAALM